MIKPFRALTFLAMVTVASGCSVYSLPGQQPAPTAPPPPSPEAAPSAPSSTPAPPQREPARDPNASDAYGGLVERAAAARSRGDYEQALSYLERAQRIDADSGEIYLELARTYAASGDDASARAAAERGLLYCRSSECEALREFTR